ncbi:MAG: phosphoribosylformylglycinamidine cyclo-ligase [Thermoplasmata archaeon]
MALEHLGRATIARTRSATFFSPLSLSATMRSSTLPTKDGLAWTYARSGVDRDAVAHALHALLTSVRFRPPAGQGRLPGPGHFAGFVRAGRETLALTTDTVGTKVLLAADVGRWSEVGEDIVAVNVNDLAAVGARPVGLVDCLTVAHPDPVVFRALGRGIDRGLRAAGCGLLGGETAVAPDIVHGFDLGGTALGHFPEGRRPVTGERIRPSDVILGIPARGFHANGFTLLRRLINEKRVELLRPRPGARTPIGRELLRPTRIYVRASEAVAPLSQVHGMAHISGGGVRNLARLGIGVGYRLDKWPQPRGVYEWVASLGQLTMEELYQTFNMGIGFVIVVARAAETRVRRRLAEAGFADAQPVGEVESGHGIRMPQFDLAYPDYSGG